MKRMFFLSIISIFLSCSFIKSIMPTSNKGLARTVMTDQQQTDSIVSLLNQVRIINRQTIWIGPDFMVVNGVLYINKKLILDSVTIKSLHVGMPPPDTAVIAVPTDGHNGSDTLNMNNER